MTMSFTSAPSFESSSSSSSLSSMSFDNTTTEHENATRNNNGCELNIRHPPRGNNNNNNNTKYSTLEVQAICETIKTNPDIVRVSIGPCLDNASLKSIIFALPSLPNLRSLVLNLSAVFLPVSVLAAIGRCKSLERLAIYDTCVQTIENDEASYFNFSSLVPYLPNLSTLIMENCNVDDEQMFEIVRNLKGLFLRKLSLRNNPRITQEGHSMASLLSVTTLNLDNDELPKKKSSSSRPRLLLQQVMCMDRYKQMASSFRVRLTRC